MTDHLSSPKPVVKPSREEAEAAVRTLLSFIGDDPDREGLVDTPSRVVKSYQDFFRGYEECPTDLLSRTFDEVADYKDLVVMKGIDVQSHCEHHIQPMLGKAHVAYLPRERVVGISKLARLVEVFSRRLQSQETLTPQIAQTIHKTLEPRGVAVIVNAQHQCITTRGVHMSDVVCSTQTFLGEFEVDRDWQDRIYRAVTVS